MSDQPQRAFSTAFKESIVLRLQAGERLAAVADELGIRRKLLLPMAPRLSQAGGRRVEPQAGPKAGRQEFGFAAWPRVARHAVRAGQRAGRRAARRRTG